MEVHLERVTATPLGSDELRVRHRAGPRRRGGLPVLPRALTIAVFVSVLAACGGTTKPSVEPEVTQDDAGEMDIEMMVADADPEVDSEAETSESDAHDGEVVAAADAVIEPPADTAVPVDAGEDVADVVGPESRDDIYGVSVLRAESWWVDAGLIYHKDAVRRLRGINWFGLETSDRALHGTWFGRKVESFLAELHTLGFDALRIPVSPESINPGFGAASWAQNAYEAGEAATGREQLERLIGVATDFAILLDFHTCDPTQLGTALPGRPDVCQGYDADRWLADLTTLATLARDHDNVLGIDLTNEPHALTWSQWKALAERGAEAVLRANPRLLVFVEGVAGASRYGIHYPFWGENLTEAASQTPNIPRSRLVFSPHAYGPGIANQSYFAAANFPVNMPAIWDAHFGHLVPSFGFAVGEFGGHYDDDAQAGEVAWNEAFVSYLATRDRRGPASFFYWCLNANSGDTGGLYLDDWTTIDQKRLTLLAPLLAR